MTLARLNDVTLVMTKALILCRAETVTCAGGHACIALANHLAVLIVALALAAQVGCQLGASATNSHIWCSRVGNMLRSEKPALIQGAFTSPITKDRLVLNVHFLIVVKFRLLGKMKSCSCHHRRKECQHESHCKLHFSEGDLLCNKTRSTDAQLEPN